MENTNVNVENQGANNTSSQNTNVNANIDYIKLEEIVNKGINQKENSILKSYFQQQGLNEDEMKEAISSYKNSRKQEEEKNAKDYETLSMNYNELEKTLLKEKTNFAISLNLFRRGLDETQAQYIGKLISTNDILVDGKIDDTKLNESIENIFKAFPGLNPQKKENENLKSFVQIGVSNNNNDTIVQDDLIRKAFKIDKK